MAENKTKKIEKQIIGMIKILEGHSNILERHTDILEKSAEIHKGNIDCWGEILPIISIIPKIIFILSILIILVAWGESIATFLKDWWNGLSQAWQVGIVFGLIVPVGLFYFGYKLGLRNNFSSNKSKQ